MCLDGRSLRRFPPVEVKNLALAGGAFHSVFYKMVLLSLREHDLRTDACRVGNEMIQKVQVLSR